MKYFKNSNWLFLERFFKLAVSFLVGLYVARYLGPENFGLLSYAVVLTGFAVPFFRLGLHPVLNKKFIEKDENENKLFGTSLVAQFVMFLVISLLFIYFLLTSSVSNEEKLIIGIIFIGKFFLIFEIYDQYFNANVQSKYISYASISSTLISAILKLGLVLYGAELLYFSIVIVIELFIKAVLLQYFLFSNKEIHMQKWQFDITLLRKLLHASWPFILTGVMTGLYMKIDQVMIKHMIDNEAVGYYSVAVRLSELWIVIPVVLSASLFPAILSAKKISQDLFEERIVGFYSILIVMAISISIIFSLCSEQLVSILFGDQFIESANILSVYVWSIVFVFINSAQWKWYLVMGYQKLALRRLIVGAALNIVLNIIFIKLFGLIGAAYATVLSYAYVGYFGNLISRKLRINFLLISKALFCPWLGIKSITLRLKK